MRSCRLGIPSCADTIGNPLLSSSICFCECLQGPLDRFHHIEIISLHHHARQSGGDLYLIWEKSRLKTQHSLVRFPVSFLAFRAAVSCFVASRTGLEWSLRSPAIHAEIGAPLEFIVLRGTEH